MSQKYHSRQSSAAYNIRVLPLIEITEQYGIEIEEDGSIWDTVEGQRFDTLTDWAAYIDELNNDELYDNFSKIGSKHEFDDGF